MMGQSGRALVGGILVWAFAGSGVGGEKKVAANIGPLPRIAPVEAKEAQKTFETQGGFQMQLLAAEPLVTDPVAMAYDENGNAYVCEMNDYPFTDKTKDPPFADSLSDPIGRVRFLRDRDGDGVFDESHVFAEGLSWPTGVAVWKGGVFIGATPDIWYCKDTDGDFKADVRRKVYTGFRKFNVQATMNNLIWGLNHHIHGAAAGNGGTILWLDRPDAKPIPVVRRDFQFDPVSGRFEAISGGARFGNTFDDFGERFICNLRNPAQHVVLPDRYLARNPRLPVASAIHDVAEFGDQVPVYRISPPEPWRVVRAKLWMTASDQQYPRSETAATGFVTSASGITIYRGSAYPARYYGNIFLGEVAGNLVHRQTLAPQGVTFVARRADPGTEFIRSTDLWFRPVNFVNAPDGTLHVLDMYRETIEHPWSIPDEIKEQLDLLSGRDRGRIYRLAPPGFRAPKTPRLSRATTAELVELLAHPNAWHRETAHRLLFERQDATAVPGLRELLHDGSDLARLHALWSLEGLEKLEPDDVATALEDRHPHVRIHALRLAEPRLTDATRLRQNVLARADDADLRVRFQAAFTLGSMQEPAAVAALARVAVRDGSDPWVRTAVLSSAWQCAPALLAELLREGHPARAPELVQELAQLIGARGRKDEVQAVLAAVLRRPADESGMTFAVIAGLGEGLRRARQSLAVWLRGADGTTAAQLAGIYDAALAAVRAADASVSLRRQAVRLLAHAAFERVSEPLVELIDARQPQELQLAAVRALAGFADPRVGPVLLQSWRSGTPAVRGEIIQALLARPERTRLLLTAVKSRTVELGQLTFTHRQLLLKHRDPAVREAALELFGSASAGNRGAVIEQYRQALELVGDKARGEAVFRRECSTCHRIGSFGHDVGPNLATVQHRGPESILTNVLDPNREVTPGYQEYVVALDDGRVVTGIVVSETATGIALKRAEGVEEVIARQNVESIAATGKSLMPEELEKKISPQEMADLLRYLLSIE